MRLLPNAMAITMQSDTKLLSRAFRRLPNAVMRDKRLGPAARVIAAGATGKAGRIGYRKWFDGKLCVNEMAAYLYFRAGTGLIPTVFASELAKTFGWSRPTGPSRTSVVGQRRSRSPSRPSPSSKATTKQASDLFPHSPKTPTIRPPVGLSLLLPQIRSS